MAKAVNYDSLFKQYTDPYEAAEAVKYYPNIICRVRRSAYIEWAYQMSELLEKGDKLIVQSEPNSRIDEWDISVAVSRNGKVQKLGYLCSFLSKKIDPTKYDAEVFSHFDMTDQSFWNFWLQILLRMK